MRFGVALDLWAREAPVTEVEHVAKPKAASTAAMKMIERIKVSGSLIELSEIVPLIQGGEFTEDEKRNMRLIFNNRKTELSA